MGSINKTTRKGSLEEGGQINTPMYCHRLA